MTIAALYDVHGNLHALEAVLDEVRSLDVDRIVVGGDVLPGPVPAECLELLLGLSGPVDFISGNGDADVVRVARGEVPRRVPENVRSVLHHSAERLSAGQLDAVADWPMVTRTRVGGLGDVLFCHATPRDDNEIFTEVTPEARLRPIFEATGADVVVCGHTHIPFDRTVGTVRIVNAGSVGMPFGAPGAHWLLLGPDGLEARMTDYDLEAAQRAISAPDYPSPMPYDLRRPPPADVVVEQFEAVALGRDAGTEG